MSTPAEDLARAAAADDRTRRGQPLTSTVPSTTPEAVGTGAQAGESDLGNRAAVEHTPGPWRWELNEKSKQLQLCGGVPKFDLTVIDLERWGMDSAIARFRTGGDGLNIMKRATEFGVAVQGREHHSQWFKAIDHPDANLISAAPDLLSELTCFHDHVIDQGHHDCDGIPGGCPVQMVLEKARGGR